MMDMECKMGEGEGEVLLGLQGQTTMLEDSSSISVTRIPLQDCTNGGLFTGKQEVGGPIKSSKGQ